MSIAVSVTQIYQACANCKALGNVHRRAAHKFCLPLLGRGRATGHCEPLFQAESTERGFKREREINCVFGGGRNRLRWECSGKTLWSRCVRTGLDKQGASGLEKIRKQESQRTEMEEQGATKKPHVVHFG